MCVFPVAGSDIYSATTEYTAVFEWQHLQHYIVDSDMHVKNTKGCAAVFPWQQTLCKCANVMVYVHCPPSFIANIIISEFKYGNQLCRTQRFKTSHMIKYRRCYPAEMKV